MAEDRCSGLACASLRGRERAFEQAPVAEALRAGRERRLGSAPAQLVDIADDLRGRPQRRKILEQQRELALVAQHLGREVLERPVLVDEPRRRDLADAGDARIAVGRVADEGEQVGDATPAPRRTSRARRRRCARCCCAGRPAPRDRRSRTARGPCPASRCGPAARRRRPRRPAPPPPARRRPRARPWARRRRPCPRAPPRAERTGRAARDPLRLRSCSRARGRCGRTRSRDRSRRRRASPRSRSAAARCAAPPRPRRIAGRPACLRCGDRRSGGTAHRCRRRGERPSWPEDGRSRSAPRSRVRGRRRYLQRCDVVLPRAAGSPTSTARA